MASPLLANNPDHTDFFHRRILLNAQYWCDYVKDKAVDTTALEGERERIVKAIAFALDLTAAWSLVYELIVNFSPFMERRGYWEIWNQSLNRAIEVARQIEDINGVITLSVLLARLLQRQSQLRQAISHYHRVIRLARQSKNLYEEARACTNLGFLYIEEGHWYRAEVLCGYALTIFETINSDHGRAHTENHLGILYTRQRSWGKAKSHLEQACILWQAMNDQHGLMRGLINQGLLHNDMEQYNEALSFLEKALQLAKLTGEETEIGTIYLNMGIAHGQKGELARAEAFTWQAEAIFRRISNSLHLILVWNNLGIVYTGQKKWKEAREYLEMALATSRDLKIVPAEVDALQGLLEYELARQNYQQAARSLSRLESFIQTPDKTVRYRHLQPRLAKYHHRLAKNLKKTSEVSKTSEVLSD